MPLSLSNTIARIITDFEYFCAYCLDISAKQWDKDPDIVGDEKITQPFKLAKHQRKFIKYLSNPKIKDKVVLKCRQRGYSTMMIAWCLWKAMYGRNENILYLIHDHDTAKEFRRDLDAMYNSIPKIFRPTGMAITADNKVHNSRHNNRIWFRVASDKVGRSGAYTMIVLDEVSKYDKSVQDILLAAVVPACPNNRVWIATPMCEDDLYHTKVKEAERDKTLWKDSFEDNAEDWFGSKDNASKWRAILTKGMPESQIIREYDCEFRGAASDTIWTVMPNIFKPVGAPARVIVSLDLGYKPDPTAILFAYDYGQVLHIFDELVVGSYTIPDVAMAIKGRGYSIKYGIMDCSGKKTDQTSGLSSYNQMIRLLGCRFYTRKPGKEEGILSANLALLQGYVYIDPERCPQLCTMLANYEYHKGTIPHNRYSHISDALVYLIHNWAKAPRSNTRPRVISRADINPLL